MVSGLRVVFVVLRRDPGGNLTDLPVTLMIARDTGGAYTDTSPNGLLEVLQRLA